MNDVPAETATTQAPAAPVGQPKAPKKPRVAAQAADVAPSKAKSGNKATAAKKANKGATLAKSPKKTAGTRRGASKSAKVLDLLRRSGGASLKELMKATGWQAHSVRGFLSGALGKRAGLTVKSAKAENAERRYSVKG